MLSQIENGKATPSMKTLQYIAEKLECETSFLLEEDEEEIVELIQQTEKLIKARYDEVYEVLLPHLKKELPPTLNTARLYKQFVTAAAKMKDYNIEYYVEKATSIFEKYTLYRDSTKQN